MLFDPANENVIGKMKDEFRRKIISEFVRLKSRICSLVDVDGKENKKAKGLHKVIVRGIRHKESLMLFLIKIDKIPSKKNSE